MKNLSTVSAVLLLVALLSSACTTVPVTGRKQFNTQSDVKVAEMSIAAFEQMKSQIPISQDVYYNEMLRNVGERISQQVFADMPLAEWEFVVFDQQEVNAFAMPGGKIGVFLGLFQVAQTEDELASVVAHEIAHVTARHTHERLSQMHAASGVGTILGIGAAIAGPAVIGNSVSVNAGSTIMGLYNIGAQGQLNTWDQAKEAEADRIGIMYMARAGYDPNAAIRVMERMVEMEMSLPQNNYNSTHPSSVERLNALHGYLDEAMVEYEKAKEFYF